MADMVENAAAEVTPAAETPSTESAAVETTAATEAAKDPFQFPEKKEGEAETPAVEETQEEPKEEVTVPEKYEFHLPEGLTLTEDVEKQFTEIAKSLNLTQEQADKLIKLHSDVMLSAMQQAEATKSEWAQECHKKGLTDPQKLKRAKLAIDTFDQTGQVLQVLVDSGVAYHPAVQGMFQRMGEILSEDTAPDNKPAAQAKSAADLLFGNSKY